MVTSSKERATPPLSTTMASAWGYAVPGRDTNLPSRKVSALLAKKGLPASQNIARQTITERLVRRFRLPGHHKPTRSTARITRDNLNGKKSRRELGKEQDYFHPPARYRPLMRLLTITKTAKKSANTPRSAGIPADAACQADSPTINCTRP